ncbi:putative tail sheath protein FI [Erwinia phage vB_EamM_Yoloswag]|uniref:Putative tail sheath protein FI n=1 Tax=Erwinia phage vB_EamM_Yoloswag TaxID=1958956 RepID=A0A1S6L3N9_9CAUD|nr:putative tail sheath protein FI [Erwinia phage vB_EamM_Yoloswag]AQT28804.1 putative tail sheath protein FI [Erwinia phage vB_EamM_Yoloswag]
MLVPNHPSPGVYSLENDRSNQQTLVTNGYCCLVLPFPKGEVGVNTTVTSVDEIDLKFGPATSSSPYARNVQYAKLLMRKATRLNITRVGLNVKYAGVYLTTYNNFTTCRPLGDAGLTDPEQIAFTDRDICLLYSVSGYSGANDIYITVEPDVNDVLGIKAIIKVYLTGSLTPVEKHTVTTKYYKDGSGNQFYIEDVINNASSYIRVKLNTANYKLVDDPDFVVLNAIAGGPLDVLNPTAINGQFTGGSDGNTIDIDHSDALIANASLSAVLTAWDNYADWEDIQAGILCSGGLEHPVVANKLDTLAASRQDSIAVHGIPVLLQQRDNAVAYRRGNKAYMGTEFSITGSWSCLSNSDALYRDTDNSRDIYVPASICMAYCMLNTDQIAQWLAPGGLNRGQLDWATDVRYRFKQNDRDVLAENQINPIAVFEGEGIYMWGADTTMTTKSPLNDIGVRRLLAMLHASVRANNLRAVFEPNDDVLKQNQKAGMESILEPIKTGRGLDWYAVVCDYTNNTAEDEARGDLIIDVFLDPTRYTKRIHVTAIVPPVGDIQYALDLISKGSL